MARIGLALLGEPSVPEMMRIARVAESLDYESVWLTETRFTRDAITTAAAVAAATKRVQVGTAVVNPFTRGAVLTAVTFATLDELAGGRAIFGIGPGSPRILDRQGIAWETPLLRLREYVDVTRRLLSGEPVSYDGKTITVRDVRLDFQPVRPTMPIYLGVTGPRALELAGEIADGVLLNGFVSTAYTRRAVERVRTGAERVGRTPDQIDVASSVVVSIDHDAGRARDAIRPLVATYLAVFPNIARESGLPDSALQAISAAYAQGGQEAAAAHVTDAIVDELTCSGTPDACRAQLAARRTAGVALPVISLAAGDVGLALEALASA